MQTYIQSPWGLSDLFPSHDSPEMEAAFAELESKVSDFETLRPQLVNDIALDAFLALIQRQEIIYTLASRIRSLFDESKLRDSSLQHAVKNSKWKATASSRAT